MQRGNLSGVSESVLFALVHALQVHEAEAAHLFDLARATTGPRRAFRTKPGPRLPERLAQLPDTVGEVPAIALTRVKTPAGSQRIHHSVVGQFTVGHDVPTSPAVPGRSITTHPHR